MHNRAKSEKCSFSQKGKKSAWKEKLPSKWIKHLNDRVSDNLLDAFGWLRQRREAYINMGILSPILKQSFDAVSTN